MKFKSEIKRLSVYSIFSIILATLITICYLYFDEIPNSLDNRFRDSFFTKRGEIPNTNNIVIIDIDEKSLKVLGQWPWSRNKISKILMNLTDANTAIIGMDVVFSEEDRTSPNKILKEFDINSKNIPNYDKEFIETILRTPTILGYQFELEDKTDFSSKMAPDISAIFIEKNKKMGEEYLIKAYSTIINIPDLQKNSLSSGFFNNIPDSSGTIRSVPLLISYENNIYPSLALEIVRLITDSKKVFINYNENGVDSILLNNLLIPTDRHGRLIVNYRGAKGNFPYISSLDIYNNNFDKNLLKDKIVLFGASAAGLLDLRSTPFDSVFPGVEVHANVIDNILKGDFIYKKPWVVTFDILIIYFLSFFITLLIAYSTFWLNPILIISSLYVTYFFLYYQLFSKGIILNIFFPLITIVLASIMSILFNYFFKIKQEEAIKKKFASKVSKEVMDKLIKNLDDKEFQVMEKEITIFFSDIRNFTKISEEMKNPKELIDYLNEYMEPMSDIINKHEGTIDKYIGDSIMAYWNAPNNVENHADKALKASIEQINFLTKINEKLKKENKPLIDIGIGLNSGNVIVGEMGSKKRSDYTVIGDTINLGSRLESLCKFYDSKINISNYTKELLKDNYIFRYLDLVKVKGKNKPVEIWQVISEKDYSHELKEEIKTYHHAIKLFKNEQFNEALAIFERLENNHKKSNQVIYKIYIQRCNEFIVSPPINFTGIFEHTNKS